MKCIVVDLIELLMFVFFYNVLLNFDVIKCL